MVRFTKNLSDLLNLKIIKIHVLCGHKLKKFHKEVGPVDVVEISAAFDVGLEDLKNKMQQIVAAQPTE